MATTWAVDADGVATMFATLPGGTTFRLGTQDPNSAANYEVEQATATHKTEGNLSFWNSVGGSVNYASGGSGRTIRLTASPSGGSQTYNWKTGAITHGYISNTKDIKNFEWTIYMRTHGFLNNHTSMSMKGRGGVHTGSHDPRASCFEMRVPYGTTSPDVSRELNHPDYDFVNLTPKFAYHVTENKWLGLKFISIVSQDGKSTNNKLYLDTNPWGADGKPLNNWQLYTEYDDVTGTDTGQYNQAATWAGWLWTSRVDGWNSLDFALDSIREIDPNSPTTSTTCPTGQHFDSTTQTCVPDIIPCPSGQVFSTEFNKCIPLCPINQHYDDTVGACVDNVVTCPTGQHYDFTLRRCVADTTGGGGGGGGGTPPAPNNGDLGFFYSGGINVSEQTAAESTGGFMSQNEIVTGDLNNLFRSIQGAEAVAGTNYYRCFYIKNKSDAATAYSISVYLWSPSTVMTGTLNPNTQVWLGKGTSPKNGIEQYMSDPTLKPTGVCFTAAYSNADKFLFIDSLGPGETQAFWIERKSHTNLNTWSRDQTLVVCEYWDQETATTVPDLPCVDGGTGGGGGGDGCPAGQHRDSVTGLCVPDTTGGGGGGIKCDELPSPSVGPDAIAQIYHSRPKTAASPAVVYETNDSLNTGDEGPQQAGAATATGAVGLQIYQAKTGGRVKTVMNESGSQGASSGIRYNFANDHDLVDREFTAVFTVNAVVDHTHDHWSVKCGSHGSTGEGCALYEIQQPWSSGTGKYQVESPHPDYHSCCSSYKTYPVPALPMGKRIATKFVSWRITGGIHSEFWYDFTNAGGGPWIKYGELNDTGSGCCGVSPNDLGASGLIKGPAKAQDTIRLNGACASFTAGSIVELAGGGILNGGGTPTCPTGQHYDTVQGKCVPDSGTGGCPAGQHLDSTTGLCVPDGCDPGFHMDPNGICVPDTTTLDPGSTAFYLDTTNWLALGSANRLRGEPSSQTITDHNSVRLTENLALGIMTDTAYSPTKITTYNQASLATTGFMMDTLDWTNVEATIYIEKIAAAAGSWIEFQIRGGQHSSTHSCEGTAYKARLYIEGKLELRKELENGIESTPTSNQQMTNVLTQPMKESWYCGFKFICYTEGDNKANLVVSKVFIDDQTDNKTTAANHWREVLKFKDDGSNWIVAGTPNCSGNTSTKITWGGPLVNIVTSGFTEYDVKKISVREIDPPAPCTDSGVPTGTTVIFTSPGENRHPNFYGPDTRTLAPLTVITPQGPRTQDFNWDTGASQPTDIPFEMLDEFGLTPPANSADRQTFNISVQIPGIPGTFTIPMMLEDQAHYDLIAGDPARYPLFRVRDITQFVSIVYKRNQTIVRSASLGNPPELLLPGVISMPTMSSRSGTPTSGWQWQRVRFVNPSTNAFVEDWFGLNTGDLKFIIKKQSVADAIGISTSAGSGSDDFTGFGTLQFIEAVPSTTSLTNVKWDVRNESADFGRGGVARCFGCDGDLLNKWSIVLWGGSPPHVSLVPV
jgi:hypothetical protein